MMYRTLAVALLTLASAGAAAAQSVYVAPGGVANIYVGPPLANGGWGAAAVFGAPDYLNGSVVPVPPIAPVPGPVYLPNGNGYGPYGAPGYDEPLSAYGTPPRGFLQRRVYITPYDDVPRPPLPVPYGWRLR